jgi:hypothetical protein
LTEEQEYGGLTCPQCHGKMAKGKFLGYEDDAYCFNCHEWYMDMANQP